MILLNCSLVLIILSGAYCSDIKDKWINTDRILTSYDKDGNISTVIAQRWKDNFWQNQKKNNYAYDSEGNEAECLTLFWLNDNWQNEYLEKKIYDSNSRIISETKLKWINSKWVDTEKDTHSYKENPKSLEITSFRNLESGWIETKKDYKFLDDYGNEIESWYKLRKSNYDEQNKLFYTDDWQKPLNRYISECDERGNVIKKEWQILKYGKWETVEITNYYFDSDDRVTSQLLQKLKDNNFINVEKTDVIYNKNGKEKEIFCKWQNELWVNENQHEFNYDEKGELYEMIFKEWKNNEFEDSFKTVYKYDERGNEIERIVTSYNFSTE